MHYEHEDDERDPFAAFGDIGAAEDDVALEDFEIEADATPVIEPKRETRVKTGFSWAGFAGGIAALIWSAGAIAGPLTYFGVPAVMAMDPAMQAGLIALAFGPALLFWLAASAAGEALKARRLAVELTRMAKDSRLPIEAGETDAKRLTDTVKNEIESLNDAVAAALERLSELETAAQRNAMLFGEAVAASRENVEVMADALVREREALGELNCDLKDNAESISQSISRQVRLMRETSKLVKTEVAEAEDAMESHLASFTATATVMGERTADFHLAAEQASTAASEMNGAMSQMLDGLSQATRLTETARKSTEQAVLAANETAGAVRETTRAAVFEAKRAAQLIRAETEALQEAAVDTLARLKEAAAAARIASDEGQAAAERHAGSIEKRLGALAATATVRRPAPAVERVVDRELEPAVATAADVTTLRAAANAAATRVGARPQVQVEEQPRRVFKGFGAWGNFMPPRQEPPVAANEDAYELADFGGAAETPEAKIKRGALDLVAQAGVDLDDVLHASDLERVARCSREGAAGRRRAVIDAAPGAVTRIARLVKRNPDAHTLAAKFRVRPELAKSEHKGEGADLVRAYLLIDAALA